MLKNLLIKQKGDEFLPPPPPIEPLDADKNDNFDELLKGLEDKGETGGPSEFMPETELFGAEDVNESGESKPFEIEEAEQEIREAVQRLKKSPTLWERIVAKLSKRKVWPLQAKHEVLVKPEMDGVKAIKSLVKEARDNLLNLNLGKAKEMYVQANKIYMELSPERQSEVYEDLKSLYDERMSAEALKLK